MAIRRFVSRRGAPSEIFSDNGTNFQGANRQLKAEITQRNHTLAAIFTNTNTRWSFNPPGAPHMGGVWERLVRSVKKAIECLQIAIRKPDDETLETIMLEAEAMINTRPLTYIPLESADQESLTPNHFLLGSSSGIKQPPVNPVDCRGMLRNSWKLVQFINDQLWRRWIKEYIPVITRRCKWFKDVRDIKVGDLVLVVDENIRNKWMRGKVVKVFLGKDGRVRQAVVKTISGLLRRAVTSLALIDVVDDDEPESTGNSDDCGSRVGECNVEPYNPAIG